MLKWIESTGRTEDAAIEAALQKLGMDRDEVSVEILERAKSGFLGIGSCPAKVKVTYEAPDEPEQVPVKKAPAAAPPAKAAPTAKAPAAPKAESKPVEAASAPRPVAPTDGEKTEQIVQFITGLLEHMGSVARPVVQLDDEGNYQVELVGEHLGGLIGRRGETLDAIQQLTSYAVNRTGGRVRVQLDAEGYRNKREQSLQHLARKVASKVTRYHRSVTLEPMNAYERHVIHVALQDVPGVTTHSTGVDPNRRVVVTYDRDKK